MMRFVRTKTFRVGVVVALILTLAATAFAAITKGMVVDILKERIHHGFVTQNARVAVKPYSSSARTAKGQFAYVAISADWAEDRKAHVKLVDVYISARDIQVDVNALTRDKKLRVLSRKAGKAHVKVYEKDVNRALALKKTPIKDLKVNFGNGEVTFTGRYKVSIKLTGRLQIKNRSEIHFIPTQASVGILGVPIGIVNKFLSSLNPVIDMKNLPLGPSISTVKVTPKYIYVAG